MQKSISEEMKKIIEENPLALATVDGSGRPNVIAVACVKVISPTELVITDNYMNITKNNIRPEREICLAVWTKDEEKGYKIRGAAQYHSSGKWLSHVKSLPGNKNLPAKGAIIVKISEITPLA